MNVLKMIMEITNSGLKMIWYLIRKLNLIIMITIESKIFIILEHIHNLVRQTKWNHNWVTAFNNIEKHKERNKQNKIEIKV